MSHASKAAIPSLLGPDPEAAVRRMIAEGKSRTALESAKELHKKQPTGATEALLLDAYHARAEGLIGQGLTQEARSLIDLTCQRYPASKGRFDLLLRTASARGGDLSLLVAPLKDPALAPDQRAAAEQTLQAELVDLHALAECATLPPEHALRQAAAALERAFTLVTSGPVTDDQIALAEVSHRSPLASWKSMIRAIACFYRGEDAAAHEHLAAVKPASAVARLVPVLKAMLDGKPDSDLKPAAKALFRAASGSADGLRRALAKLDGAFFGDQDPRTAYSSVRNAVEECQQEAPDLVADLKVLIAVRSAPAGFDPARIFAALGGAPRQDANYYRAQAHALEMVDEAHTLALASEAWSLFRAEAIREGWFAADGLESGAIYLRMADLISRIPHYDLQRLQNIRSKGMDDVDRSSLFPETLFARACAMDPHEEPYSRWLRWAAQQKKVKPSAEDVARQWSQARPADLEPVLFLIERAEKKGSLPTALTLLDKAESIDAVHPKVRTARLRLLALAAIRHVEQKRPHLAEQKLAAIAELPQARQGYRPAFIAAFRHGLAKAKGDETAVAAALAEAEGIRECPVRR